MAGDFPQKETGISGFSRKGLRNRIIWADKRAIETLRPRFVYSIDSTKPATASVNEKKRPWDIPIIASDNVAEIPRNWRELVQLHEEDFYRLDPNFATTQLPGLIVEGKLLREVMIGYDNLGTHLHAPGEIWSRLREVLMKQHAKTRAHYEDSFDSLDDALRGPLREECEAVYLIFSLIDVRQSEYNLEPDYLKLSKETKSADNSIRPSGKGVN
jgi:hypothetical protein